MNNKIDSLRYVVAPLFLVLLPTILYWPGLTGGFHLDDYPNLQSLSVFSREGLFYYLAQGQSGPLGRPLSMLTFLLDDNTWPSRAEYFLPTNLAIHLLCGLTLYWFIFKLSQHLEITQPQRLALAFFCSLFWMVHPINVSTVLYTVQRMTQLATLFSLAALVAYIYALENVKNKIVVPCLLLFLFFVACAVLSKENGILVLLCALLVEAWVKRGGGFKAKTRLFNWWKLAFLYLPILLVVVYFALNMESHLAAYSIREFTLAERLMTECRVLVSYLASIAIPFRVESTLFYDDIEVSKGLFQPLTTVFSLLVLVALLVSAWFLRNRVYVYSFAVFWFFSGHLLESTFVPLELYFEHRNYTPSIGVALFMAYLVVSLPKVLPNIGLQNLVSGIFIVLLVFVGSFSSLLVKAWGNENQLIYEWAYYKPESYRSQSLFTQLIALQGFKDTSIEILSDFSKKTPNNLTVRARLAAFDCEYNKKISQAELAYIESEKPIYDIYLNEAYSILKRYHRLYNMKSCPEVTLELVSNVFEGIISHPHVKYSVRHLAVLNYTHGRFLASHGQLDDGLELLDRASMFQPTVDIPLKAADLTMQAGDFERAEHYLKLARARDEARGWRYSSRIDDVSSRERLLDLMISTSAHVSASLEGEHEAYE